MLRRGNLPGWQKSSRTTSLYESRERIGDLNVSISWWFCSDVEGFEISALRCVHWTFKVRARNKSRHRQGSQSQNPSAPKSRTLKDLIPAATRWIYFWNLSFSNLMPIHCWVPWLSCIYEIWLPRRSWCSQVLGKFDLARIMKWGLHSLARGVLVAFHCREWNCDLHEVLSCNTT